MFLLTDQGEPFICFLQLFNIKVGEEMVSHNMGIGTLSDSITINGKKKSE